MPTVAIVDAYSLLYRAFFALPPLTNKAGEVTNAVYGFTMMLMKLLDDERPDYLVVAFDMPAATFRHEAFEEYKAHRKPMPDEMRPQVPMTREVLEAMRVPMIGIPGFEADDVIGTLACRAAGEGWDALIVTADKDALQLVNDRVHVLANKKGITETITYDRQAVIDRFGVAPEQIPDMKALTGDSSDNIPGVPGIGEKTAAKLLQRFGTLENLLDHVDEVEGKVGATLATYTEQARASKHLATIETQVPLDEDFTWEGCRVGQWDQARLLELFRHLDFRTLISRLETQPAAASAPTAAATEAPAATRTVEAPAEIAALVAGIRERGACAVIPVGEGADPLRGRLAGVAISAGPELTVYVPLLGKPPAQPSLFEEELPSLEPAHDRLQALAPLFTDPEVRKHGHDLKALILWLRAAGITLRGVGFDTLIAAYLIDPAAPHKPGDLALDHLHAHVETPDLVKLWQAGGIEALAEAAGTVVGLVRRLEAPLRETLAALDLMPLYRDIEMPLVPLLADMQALGVAVDRAKLEDLSAELGKAIREIEGDIYALAGETFTINSPKQLQVILFEKMHLPRGRKTKTGYSTDAETLRGLAEEHEIVRKILRYRELTKLKSTYVDALPQLINPRTGRVHTHFNQAVTATGRLSSSDPNLQNIPIRSPEGREIRGAFVPGEAGWRLLAADYSQIELRVLAHITRDPSLIEVFRRGEDLHTATAVRVFGVEPDAVTREMRRMAKIVNFSIPYGTTAFGLAGQIGCSREMAQELMDTYLARFPGVAEYMREIVATARRDGFVTTLCGRRRPLPDLHAPNPNIRQAAERTAINTPIQGSAADIMKLAMLHLAEALAQRPDLAARLLLQVHDEMVLETPADQVDPLAEVVRAAMQGAYPLIVPMNVEVKIGPNWRDVTPVLEELPLSPELGEMG
jgi:DNA polymerase-1